jgi:hypothetical protein
LDAIEQFDGIEAADACPDRAAHGLVAIHDVGEASAVLLHEGTTLDLQRIAARVEHDARAQALVLAQARRLPVGEAQASGDFAVDHFRRDRRHRARVRCAVAAGQLRRHADRQVAREAFRHLDLDFELRQVDHAQHRRIDRDIGALRDLYLADLAVERRAQRQRVDLALQFGDDRALAVGEQVLVARIQSRALALQRVVLLRVGDADLGFLQVVLRAGHVDLRHRASGEAALVAFQVALGRHFVDPRLVQQLARGRPRQLRIQRRTAGFGLQAGERRLLLRELAAQFGAVDLGQRLALLDDVAGDDVQRDRAARDRVQGRTVGCDHAAVGGNVAHQVAARDRGDAHAACVEGSAAAAPAREQPRDHQQSRDAHRATDEPRPARARCLRRGAGDGNVLGGGVTDAHAALASSKDVEGDKSRMRASPKGLPRLAVAGCPGVRGHPPVSARTHRALTPGRYTGGLPAESNSCAASSARSRIAMWFPC